MQAAAKLSITIPANHRVELRLPDDLPAGPAEVIILTPLRSVPVDRLSVDEAQLDDAAQTAVAQDRPSFAIAPSSAHRLVQSPPFDRHPSRQLS